MKSEIKIIITILITISMFVMSVISANRPIDNHEEADNHEATKEQIIEDTVEQTIHTESYEPVKESENDETETIETVETIEEVTEDNTIDSNSSEIANDVDVENTTEEVERLVSLGKFKLTAYCSCSKCCGQYAANRPKDEYGNDIVYGSIGIRLVEGVSIAVDPSIIPYKSEVIINGNTYFAHDTGGKIKGNRIDVYFENHNNALKFGVQYAEVFVKM